MKKITVEVNENAADKWKLASNEFKLEVALFIEALLKIETSGNDSHETGMPDEKFLKNHLKKVQSNLSSHTKFRNKVCDIATKNGLTEEILDDILNMDD